MSKKIIIIITIVVLILIIINAKNIYNLAIQIYAKTIEYDIKISYSGFNSVTGGYATNTSYYLIDVDRKVEYEISNCHVYGVEKKFWKRGDNYSIKKEEISREYIEDLLKYKDYPSEEPESILEEIANQDIYKIIYFKDINKSVYIKIR